MEPGAAQSSQPVTRPRLSAAARAAGATALVAGAFLAATALTDLPAAYWLTAAVALIAEARPGTPAERRRPLVVGPSAYPSFAILLGWGPGPTLGVLAAAAVVDWWRTGAGWWPALLGLGRQATAAAAAATVLHAGGLLPYPAAALAEPAGLTTVLAAAAGWVVAGYAVTLAARAARFDRPRPALVPPSSWESLTYVGLLPLAPAVVAATGASTVLAVLAAVPLYAVHRAAVSAEGRRAPPHRDPLTGLGNRAALTEAVTALIAGRGDTTRGPDRFAVLLLDLNRFKSINSALGHRVGDRLLVEAGRRVQAAVGRGDLVVRLGGDEFAVLAPGVSGVADARALAGAIVAGLAGPVRLDGLSLEVSSSVGVAVYPDHGADATTLLRRAEVAMYDAKRRAAPVAVYQPGSEQDSPDRLELLADLRTALETPGGSGVVMYYQPQVAIDTGEVVGVEALLRWHHPVHGPVPPAELIRVAEHTDVMRRLTMRIVDDVVEQAAKWAAAGVELRASINISIRDLHTGEVAERVARRLREFQLPAARLQLEITEGALMADPHRVLATLAALERLGVAISLDDFGTGYSSLQHLRRLPLAEVKIDRSFVLGMATDADDAAIVASIVDLAGSLGLRVVAEGVEDEATWRQLAAVGCHVGQGWFFARPMPGDEILPWLARHRPVPAPGAGAPDA